jgi:hypothetical protein
MSILMHFRRVLSTSTQLTANTVIKYWDPKNFNLHRQPFQAPPSALSICGLLYGIVTFLSDEVPFRLFYGRNPGMPTGATPDLYHTLHQAMLWRIMLILFLKTPILLVFVTLQSRWIDPTQHTIISVQANNRPRSYRNILFDISWLRVCRLTIQCLAVGATSVVLILFFGMLQLRQLKHFEEMRTWVYGIYLNPGRSADPLTDLRTLYFWWRNAVITFNPWRWLFPPSERFQRWQVFGAEL